MFHRNLLFSSLLNNKKVLLSSSNEETTVSGSVMTIKGTGSFPSYFNLDCSITQVVLKNYEKLSNHAFSGCKHIIIITLPETLTEIGDYSFENCYSLLNIQIPDSVAIIGKSAFDSCYSLLEIHIPDSLTSIDSSVFQCCYELKNISISSAHNYFSVLNNSVLLNKNQDELIYCVTSFNMEFECPSTVKTIKTKAFANCLIKGIVLGQSVEVIEAHAFDNCTKLTDASLSHVKEIQEYTFYNDIALETVSFPDDLTLISSYVFAGCKALKQVSLPSSLTTLSDHLFDGCENLETVNFSDSLTSFGKYCFYNCNNLKTLNIPKNCKEIGEGFIACCPSLLLSIDPENKNFVLENNGSVLYNSDRTVLFSYSLKFELNSLESFDVPSTVTEIKASAFEMNIYLLNINLPEQTKIIGDNCFMNCWQIEKIDLSHCETIGSYAFSDCEAISEISLASIKAIGANAFEDCTSLEKIELPSSIEILSDGLFKGCEQIYSITLPSNLKTISSQMLMNCDHLNDITIGSEITIIGKEAFSGCIDLEKINLPSTIETISEKCFQYCEKLQAITIPSKVSFIGDYAFSNCPALSSINVETGNSNYASKDNVLYTKDLKKVLFYPYTNPINVEIQEGIEYIGAGAFYQNEKLESISFPDSLLGIEYSAFYGCKNLKHIELPENFTSIYDYAFYECASLNNITFNSHIKIICKYAFMLCSSLTELILPNSLEKLEDCCFQECRAIKSVRYCGSDLVSQEAFVFCTGIEETIVASNYPYPKLGGTPLMKSSDSPTCPNDFESPDQTPYKKSLDATLILFIITVALLVIATIGYIIYRFLKKSTEPKIEVSSNFETLKTSVDRDLILGEDFDDVENKLAN